MAQAQASVPAKSHRVRKVVDITASARAADLGANAPSGHARSALVCQSVYTKSLYYTEPDYTCPNMEATLHTVLSIAVNSVSAQLKMETLTAQDGNAHSSRWKRSQLKMEMLTAQYRDTTPTAQSNMTLHTAQQIGTQTALAAKCTIMLSVIKRPCCCQEAARTRRYSIG